MKRIISLFIACLLVTVLSGAAIGMINPWKETTSAGLAEVTGAKLIAPKDATNVVYRVLESEKLGEMQFDLDGMHYDARVKSAAKFEDISGLYYKNWGKANEEKIGWCKGIEKRTADGTKTVDLCLWYDAAPGLMYSLSTVSEDDLNGFDIIGIVEQVYTPMQTETEGDTKSGLDNTIKKATSYTEKANKDVYKKLDFNDKREVANATRGLLDAPKELVIKDANGKIVWSQAAYSFIEKDAPATANPSLWRDTQLNHAYGLFKVAEGIYQVRGYDMANITFVKGNTGWIVFDPLMAVECSKAAFDLVKKNLGDYPVKAIIYSHSHIDHYGGVKGIIDEKDVLNGKVAVIAPNGFEKHAVSENVYAGIAMGRRASYQYGTLLQPGDAGTLCIGIGMGQAKGTPSYISPTINIEKTGQVLNIDGVKMEFQLTPGTEAPAEMNVWFPEKKALWMAENCTGTLHNLYTLRGAEVRNGNDWAEYLMESLALYGDKVDVVFNAHNWPHWDNKNIKEYVTNTAAAYKYINDQTLFYINEGYTSTEIANMIKLPPALEKVWYTRQYYGTVAHDSKAVYQKYMGWYDANPIHLAELTPEATAKKYVEYLGDTDKVLAQAKADYDKGEYQWVAQITNTLVFADPTNKEARYLCADALEQLGYQAESGTWRNAYLSAAQELRNGTNTDPATRATRSPDTMRCMAPYMMLDYLGIVVDSTKVPNLSFKANLVMPDDKYTVIVHNGIVLYQKGVTASDADATWKTDKAGLAAIITNDKKGIEEKIVQTGDKTLLGKLLSAVPNFMNNSFFNIIEP